MCLYDEHPRSFSTMCLLFGLQNHLCPILALNLDKNNSSLVTETDVLQLWRQYHAIVFFVVKRNYRFYIHDCPLLLITAW